MLERTRVHIIITTVVFSAVCGLIGPLYAFELSVSPPTVIQAIEPGGTLDGEITIVGKYETATRMSVIYNEWDMGPDGTNYFMDNPKEPNARSIRSFLTCSPYQFTFGNNGTQVIKYRIKAPKDITGGYWGAMVIEGSGSAAVDKGIGIIARGRVAVLFYVEVQRGAVRDGKITRVTAKWDPAGRLTMGAGFANVGNVLVRLKGSLTLQKPNDDKILAKAPFADIPVLPGGTRDLAETWQGSLSPGSYVVIAKVDYGGRSIVAGQKTIKIPG